MLTKDYKEPIHSQGGVGNSFSGVFWPNYSFIEGLNALLRLLFKSVFLLDDFKILLRCRNGMWSLCMHVLKQLVQMDTSLTGETF